VTGRLPILTLAEAAAIYDELEQEYNDLIERVNALGENALEAQTLALDAKTVKTTPVFEGTGTRPFERGAVAEDVDVKRLRKPYSAAQVLDLTRKSLEKRFAE
jgi:DNA-binding ferritin-like protein